MHSLHPRPPDVALEHGDRCGYCARARGGTSSSRLGVPTNVLLQNDDYDDDSEDMDQRDWIMAEDRNGYAEREAEDEGSCL